MGAPSLDDSETISQAVSSRCRARYASSASSENTGSVANRIAPTKMLQNLAKRARQVHETDRIDGASVEAHFIV